MNAMDEKVKDHFRRVDPTLFSIIDQVVDTVGPITLTRSIDYFSSLCREILGQQLSDKASSAILSKFKKLFPRGVITPQKVLRLTKEQMRAAGPSWAKVDFIRDLAKRVLDRQLDLTSMDKLNDILVIEELTKVKGIGPWTAEMFLMFSLARPDVFSHGDLGLRKAIIKLYKFKREPTKKQIEKLSEHWSPYRTYACRILWNYLEI